MEDEALSDNISQVNGQGCCGCLYQIYPLSFPPTPGPVLLTLCDETELFKKGCVVYCLPYFTSFCQFP